MGNSSKIMQEMKRNLSLDFNEEFKYIRPSVGSDETPTYIHNSPKLGKALILNNTKLLGQERLGADRDKAEVTNCLSTIGFEHVYEEDLSATDMQNIVKTFSKESFKDYAILLVVVMSGGTSCNITDAELRGDHTEILDNDHDSLPVNEIINAFAPDKCDSTLIGKPKIFIFQCSRTKHGKGMEIETDHNPDTLIAYSTAPGQESFRCPINGSVYIQTLCQIFRNFHQKYHVSQMLDVINDQIVLNFPDLPQHQLSNYHNYRFKRCYLYLNS